MNKFHSAASQTADFSGLIPGYDLGVDDDLQAVGMEHAADVHVELVELVDGPRAPDVPQHPVVQHQVVGGVEGGAVPLVVVGQGGVVQGQGLLARVDVVDLQRGATFGTTDIEERQEKRGVVKERERNLREPLGPRCR